MFKSEKREKQKNKKKNAPRGSTSANIQYMQVSKGQARKSKKFMDKVTKKPSVHFLFS